MGSIERISISRADRDRLERLVRDRNTPQKAVWQAPIVLLVGDGVGAVAIAAVTGNNMPTVRRRPHRYAAKGVLTLVAPMSRRDPATRRPALSRTSSAAVETMTRSGVSPLAICRDLARGSAVRNNSALRPGTGRSWHGWTFRATWILPPGVVDLTFRSLFRRAEGPAERNRCVGPGRPVGQRGLAAEVPPCAPGAQNLPGRNCLIGRSPMQHLPGSGGRRPRVCKIDAGTGRGDGARARRSAVRNTTENYYVATPQTLRKVNPGRLQEPNTYVQQSVYRRK